MPVTVQKFKDVTKYVFADNVTSNQTITGCPELGDGYRTATAKITGTGVISATVTMYGTDDSIDSTEGILVYTFPLSGTTSNKSHAPNSGEEISKYTHYYITIAGIIGTSAAVTFTLSVGGA